MTYTEQGDGVPVVLLHGFPLCRQMWRAQIDPLANAGFRVICPDLPGFGESEIAGEAGSITFYADAVIALLDELQVSQAVIGGMSMGGYVLLNLLDRFPDRLLGGMFLVTRASADDAAGKEKRTALAGEVAAGNRQVVTDTFEQVLFAPDTPRLRPDLVDEVRRWMTSTSADGLVSALLAMRDRRDFIDKLPDFALPSLVVGAELDQAVPAAHARILAEGLPHARLAIIPNAGHMANLEESAAFNRILIDFLSAFQQQA